MTFVTDLEQATQKNDEVAIPYKFFRSRTLIANLPGDTKNSAWFGLICLTSVSSACSKTEGKSKENRETEREQKRGKKVKRKVKRKVKGRLNGL